MAGKKEIKKRLLFFERHYSANPFLSTICKCSGSMHVNSSQKVYSFDEISTCLHNGDKACSCDCLLFDDKTIWFIEFKTIVPGEDEKHEIREELKYKPILSLYLFHRCLVDPSRTGNVLEKNMKFVYFLVVNNEALECVNSFVTATMQNPNSSCEKFLHEFAPWSVYSSRDPLGNSLYFDEVKAFTQNQFEHQFGSFHFPMAL